MPKVKTVISLYSQCINRVKSHLKVFDIPVDDKLLTTWRGSPWDRKRTESESDMNPFETLPAVLLDAIIQSFCGSQTENTIVKHHINIRNFITTKLQKLIVPSCPYDYEQFSNFLPKLEKLQVLALCYSNIDDSCLKLIATCCKNLRILDISKCKKLTDTGIEWLVPKTAELSKTLLELMVGCDAVTKRGIIFVVQNCPSLEVVENINVFDALVELARSSALAQSNILNTNITRLILRPAEVYLSGQLELVVRFCPSVFHMIIFVKEGLTDTDLFCLTSLKNLQILKIIRHSSSTLNEITFDKSLAPVLKVIGSLLEVLYIAYFELVDIWTVVKFCPNLMSLSLRNHCQSLSVLSENEIIQLRNEKGRGYFQDLKILGGGFNLSNDILFGLLSCPLLESVWITHCDALTDELLQEVIANGSVKNLKILSLNFCHLVTKQGLDALVMNDNRLEQLSFRHCLNITQQNVCDWNEYARCRNWELRINRV
ncbi:SCF E3 ubiquitin ligase complex F-box protein grrA-like [Daphnia pulex]|uniref:SCF E3 ubiquitin ligase complex F-box protein grrA-like n=1 Tax=Daphnia pulex TaxID=6669 RepID=UPI001EE048DB|nr:SCF E3 ubiquitin ligase complex F-box protein grrA-like [Daphnia pulex]